MNWNCSDERLPPLPPAPKIETVYIMANSCIDLTCRVPPLHFINWQIVALALH